MRTAGLSPRSRFAALAVAMFVAAAHHLHAQTEPPYPTWWYNQGLISGTAYNDFAAANQGEAKNFAVSAINELDADLAQFGGSTLDALALSLTATSQQTSDYSVINLGQLKSLIQPIYDRLLSLGYYGPPLSSGTAMTSGTYPWSISGLAANDYAAANIGQLKYLFSFDVQYSSTGSPIPDWWLNLYGLPVSTSAAAFVPWSGGQVTYQQAYEQGLNPTNFYNGASTTLTVVSGASQTGSAGGLVSSPLVVSVTDSNGNAFIGAPVVFTVPDDGSQILVSNTATPVTSGTVLTNSDGEAQIFYQLPAGLDDWTSSINVTAGTSGTTVNEYSDSGDGTYYPSPFVPTGVVGSMNADGSETITWQNNDSVDLIYVYEQQTTGSWIVSGTLQAGTTTYTAPASEVGLVEIGNQYSPGGSTGSFAPGNCGNPPTGPGNYPFVPIPALSYAAVDISSATTGTGTAVTQIAMDDQGNAAFGFVSSTTSGTIGNGYATQYSTYLWQSGTAALAQTVAMEISGSFRNIIAIDSSGRVYGVDATIENGPVTGSKVPSYRAQGGNIEDLYPPQPPYYEGDEESPPTSPEIEFSGAANSGAYFGQVDAFVITGSDSMGDPIGYSTDSIGAVEGYNGYKIWPTDEIVGGPEIVAFDEQFAQYPSLSVAPRTKVVNGWFEVAAVSGSGYAISNNAGNIATGETGPAFWDGSNFHFLPFTPGALNDSGMVLGPDASGTAGYLWSSVSGTQSLSQLIPPQYRREISSFSPVLISGTDANGNVKILFAGATWQTDASGDLTTGTGNLVLTSGTGGAAQNQLQQVSLPSNISFRLYHFSTNSLSSSILSSQGVFANICLVSDTNGNWSLPRAVLLVPVQLKQTNYPTNCLADDTDPGLTGTQTISSGTSGVPCTAYITGSAAMPALQVSIGNGSLSGMQVQWWMTTTSDRSVRGTADNVQIPNPEIGYRTLPINEPWEIDNDYGGQFFGGIATIHYIIQDSNGNALTPEQTFPFLIRGRNPMDANAKTYIQNNEGAYFFAWAIAEHESRAPLNHVWNYVYNQFAIANGSSWGDLGQPFYSVKEGNGWGMFQRDPTGGGAPVTTGELYSWHTNTSAAITELGVKQSLAQAYFTAVQRTYPSQYEAPPDTDTVWGKPGDPATSTTLTALQAAIITLYNGASVVTNLQDGGTNSSGQPTYSTYLSCWRFYPNNASGNRWKFIPNSQDYVFKVIYNDYEGHSPTSE